MNDSILDKYVSRKAEVATDIDADHEEDLVDLQAFGFLRGARDRAIMLELRKKTGNVRAIGYAWLERVEFDPSQGISLFVAGQKIRIVGRNLNAELRPNLRLFQGITRHRIPWIQEADEAAVMNAVDGTPLIERIEW